MKCCILSHDWSHDHQSLCFVLSKCESSVDRCICGCWIIICQVILAQACMYEFTDLLIMSLSLNNSSKFFFKLSETIWKRECEHIFILLHTLYNSKLTKGLHTHRLDRLTSHYFEITILNAKTTEINKTNSLSKHGGSRMPAIEDSIFVSSERNLISKPRGCVLLDRIGMHYHFNHPNLPSHSHKWHINRTQYWQGRRAWWTGKR